VESVASVESVESAKSLESVESEMKIKMMAKEIEALKKQVSALQHVRPRKPILNKSKLPQVLLHSDCGCEYERYDV
jgi:hypothetical protein